MSRSIITMDGHTIKTIWPYNLAYAIFVDFGKAVMVYSVDLIKCIDEELTEREAKCLRLYYKHGMTYNEVGDAIGVTGARVREIVSKCLRKLRHPARTRQYMLHTWGELEFTKYENDKLLKRLNDIDQNDGFDEYLKSINYENYISEKSREEFLESSIINLNLETRSLNVIKRWNLYSIRDLIETTANDIMSLRGCGQKTIEDILYKLSLFDLGLKDMNWDQYQEMIKKGEI